MERDVLRRRYALGDAARESTLQEIANDDGRPVPGIIHLLETHPFDLVALGSHGRRGIRRFLLGSVAENIVRHAPCSVLVAHGLPDAARRAP